MILEFFYIRLQKKYGDLISRVWNNIDLMEYGV